MAEVCRNRKEVAKRRPFLWGIFRLILIALCLVGFAASQSPETHVVDWISKPDRQDFPWKIQVSSPRLTFQQRYLVHIRISLGLEALEKVGTDGNLIFLVRVADKDGHWLPGEAFRPFQVPPGLDKRQEIQFDSGIYLLPGEYTVALLVYDRQLKSYNLVRRQLRVAGMKNNPLPAMDHGLPAVEFVTDVPKDTISPPAVVARLPRVNAPPRVVPRIGPGNDHTWPLAHDTESLTIENVRPLRIDLILDFSNWTDPNFEIENSGQTYRQDVGRLLQIGSLLSHLSPKDGCVHVSALDVLKMKTLFDRREAKTLDWDDIQKQVTGLDQATVDVRALNAQSQTEEFFGRFVARVSESEACSSQAKEEQHIVIVAPTSRLALSGHGEQALSEVECDCRYFYFRPPELPHGSGSDDMRRVLKLRKPFEFDISDPANFRKDLAKLIAEIERAANGRTGRP